MKILQVFDLFSLAHGGGTVDVISKLSKALAERGHEVTVCTGDYGIDREYIKSIESTGVRFKKFRSYVNRFGVYIIPEMDDLDLTEYDVIHLHCYRSFQNAGIYNRAKRYKVPYIIDAHGSTVDIGVKNIIRKLYDYAYGYNCLKHASRCIAETEVGVKEWRKLGVPESKITLLHPFIDIAEIESCPKFDVNTKHNRVLNNDMHILFLGRLHPDKGLEFLINAFAELCKKRNSVKLILAGQDGGYKTTLDRLIQQQGIMDKVIFTGFISGEEKIKTLALADMLIQPSKYEAGARPSLEALMCGTPVIVTEGTGAGLEIGRMNAGFRVRYGDIPDMVNAMTILLDNPKEGQYWVARGQQYIKANLSLESQIPKYEQLYKEVIV